MNRRPIALRIAVTALSIELLACVTKSDPTDLATVHIDGQVVRDEPEPIDDDSIVARAHELVQLGDAQGALVELRLAEDRLPERLDSLRVEQATMLRLMHRDDSALTLLMTVVDEGSDDVAVRRALALAGVIHADREELVRAEDLLRRATANDDAWRGYARALSDLGVVLLRRGDDRGGVSALGQAQQRFLADGDAPGAEIVEENLRLWEEVTGRRRDEL